MRRSVTDQAAAAPDFVLDDSIFRDTPPAAAEPGGFRLDDNKEIEGGDFEASAAVPAAAIDAPLNKRRNFPFSWRLLGSLLLVAGFVGFVVQGRYLDPVFIKLRTPRDRAAPTTATAGRTDASTASAPATRSERAVVSPKPKPELKRAATAAQPVLPLPTPARNPPSPAEPETAPVVVAPSEKREEDAWFSLAEEYLQMGDVDRAAAIYLRFSREGAQRGRASLALGDIYFKKGDSLRAREYYRQSEQQFREIVPQTSQP